MRKALGADERDHAAIRRPAAAETNKRTPAPLTLLLNFGRWFIMI